MPDKLFTSAIPADLSTLPKLDTSVAHIARVYDYWPGGRILDIHPEIALSVRANGGSSPARCATWPRRKASGSSSTWAPACRRLTTPVRWCSSGGDPRPYPGFGAMMVHEYADLARALSERNVGESLSRRLIPWEEMPD
jgi:hypothetical protein